MQRSRHRLRARARTHARAHLRSVAFNRHTLLLPLSLLLSDALDKLHPLQQQAGVRGRGADVAVVHCCDSSS